jgi:hypothetical protein
MPNKINEDFMAMITKRVESYNRKMDMNYGFNFKEGMPNQSMSKYAWVPTV